MGQSKQIKPYPFSGKIEQGRKKSEHMWELTTGRSDCWLERGRKEVSF